MRGKEYVYLALEKVDYYSVYRMMITIAKSLFGSDLFVGKRNTFNKIKYSYVVIDLKFYENHKALFDNKNNKIDFLE